MSCKDKNKERNRYDQRASELLKNQSYELSSGLYSYMMEPVFSYRNLLGQLPAGCRVLEIGAGMGENSEFLLKKGHILTATDISPNSVEVLKKKYASYKNFDAEVADMESLPFGDKSFDIVCSAGSLSYGDNILVMNEIYRVLKQDGSFIAIDSLNNNPVFRLNRFIHFLLGNRSKSTLLRMPNIKLIDRYKLKFGDIEVFYFGSLTWLLPFLRFFLNKKQIKNISNGFDKKLRIKKSAFKFTMRATKV